MIRVSNQVAKLKRLAEQKEMEIEHLKYEKYNHLFEATVRMLKKERVMMYGGTAINELLPNNLKFYPERTLPDIDVFAVDAEKVAMRVVKEYTKLGFAIPSYSEALHNNTYRVFAEGLQVLDVTTISEKDFRKLAKGSIKTPLGLKAVNPLYLTMSLHNMLSHPYDAYRWPKVYQRLSLMYQAYAPKHCPSITRKDIERESTSIPPEVLVAFDDWAKEKECILFGLDVVKKYMNSKHALGWSGSTVRDVLIAGDLPTVANELVRVLAHCDIGVSDVYTGNIAIPDHIFITYRGQKIIGLYTPEKCTSFIEYDGYPLASIHTICAIYMSMLFSPYRHHNKNFLKCIVDELENICMRIAKKPSSKKLLSQFTLKCYGQFEGAVTMMRNKIQRNVKK